MTNIKSFFENKLSMIEDLSEDEEFLENFLLFKESLASQGKDALLMVIFTFMLREVVEGEIEAEQDLLARVSFLENDLNKIKKIVKRLKS